MLFEVFSRCPLFDSSFIGLLVASHGSFSSHRALLVHGAMPGRQEVLEECLAAVLSLYVLVERGAVVVDGYSYDHRSRAVVLAIVACVSVLWIALFVVRVASRIHSLASLVARNRLVCCLFGTWCRVLGSCLAAVGSSILSLVKPLCRPQEDCRAKALRHLETSSLHAAPFSEKLKMVLECEVICGRQDISFMLSTECEPFVCGLAKQFT